MNHYARMTGLEELGVDFNNSSFRSTWKTIYDKSEYFPALIINSYATSGVQGNAFSLTLDKKFNDVFTITETKNRVDLLNAKLYKTILKHGLGFELVIEGLRDSTSNVEEPR